MDSIKEKVELRKSEILQNINSSLNGEENLKGEIISIQEFRDRLSKGEKFFTPADIEKFNSEVDEKIVKSYTEEQKLELRKSANEQLSILKSVKVQNELGKAFDFFTKAE